MQILIENLRLARPSRPPRPFLEIYPQPYSIVTLVRSRSCDTMPPTQHSSYLCRSRPPTRSRLQIHLSVYFAQSTPISMRREPRPTLSTPSAVTIKLQGMSTSRNITGSILILAGIARYFSESSNMVLHSSLREIVFVTNSLLRVLSVLSYRGGPHRLLSVIPLSSFLGHPKVYCLLSPCTPHLPHLYAIITALPTDPNAFASISLQIQCMGCD